MKPFRKLILCVAAALLITPALKAQQPPPPQPPPGQDNPQRPKGLIKEVLAQLNLTDDQIAQLKEIHQGDGTPKEKMKKVMAVLTPEQKQKFVELLQGLRQKQQANGNSGNDQNSGNNQTPANPPANTSPNPPKLAPYNPAPVQPLDL